MSSTEQNISFILGVLFALGEKPFCQDFLMLFPYLFKRTDLKELGVGLFNHLTEFLLLS